jgi:hypothetical protein
MVGVANARNPREFTSAALASAERATTTNIRPVSAAAEEPTMT